MKLKSSVLSGEFWLYGLLAAAMIYLQSKGITAADIKAHGEALIIRAQDYVTELAPLVLAIAFGVKRTILKWQQTKAELQIELAKIRAAVSGDGGDIKRPGIPDIPEVPPIPPENPTGSNAT
ncbi:MAG: hypothetical protein KQH59_18425 [Desulfobulbaceae bacterium]|nr:hypothetical protein [Desulfobulbaceae bacterium]